MDIGVLSAGMSLTYANNDIGMLMLGKSLELMDDFGEGMIEIMESSVNPELGQNIDLRI